MVKCIQANRKLDLQEALEYCRKYFQCMGSFSALTSPELAQALPKEQPVTQNKTYDGQHAAYLSAGERAEEHCF